MTDIICKHRVSSSFYQEKRRWLDTDPKRRLFFIEDRGEIPDQEDLIVLTNDRRVKIFYLETPLQEEVVAKKIAHMAAFKELEICDERWKALIEPYKLAIHLLISDAADFGVGVFSHLRKNLQKPARSFLGMKGAMANVPAVIIGAGPSLEQSGEALKKWKDVGLLIAAGSAIQVLDVEPDLAAATDMHTPLLRRTFSNVPLCFQGRVHPDSLTRIKGPFLYLPDSHFSFDSYLTGQERFNSGWTVGTMAVAMAAHLGCNPIILVGMDYCYRGNQKYANQKGSSPTTPLITVKNGNGESVQTQGDWLMAIRWLEEFAKGRPEISFINASVGGMRIGESFCVKSLEEVALGEPGVRPGVMKQWNEAMNMTCPIDFDLTKLNRWKESLKRCKKATEGEAAMDLLLNPLWQIWAPMFERELMNDPQPLPMEEKLKIQKRLFFQQIIDEHTK